MHPFLLFSLNLMQRSLMTAYMSISQFDFKFQTKSLLSVHWSLKNAIIQNNLQDKRQLRTPEKHTNSFRKKRTLAT